MIAYDAYGCLMAYLVAKLPARGAQATASVTAQNFLQPADDLGFRVDYKHPYLWGRPTPIRPRSAPPRSTLASCPACSRPVRRLQPLL